MESNPMGAKILTGLVAEKKLDPMVLYWLECEVLTQAYNWTPKEIEEQDTEAIAAYGRIAAGRARGRESKENRK